jgi:hypothetical protein
MTEFLKFKTLKSKIVLLIALGLLAWATSITIEFVGYDDIKLIVRNERIHKSILYAITFYWNVVSDSHNVAWTNYPTVIYRPLEWVGSSLGYHIWGPRGWAFHLFVNFSFHLFNAIILYFIISKVFYTPISSDQDLKIPPIEASLKKQTTKNKKSKKKAINIQKLVSVQHLPITWFVPIVIIALWYVHPLHNESVNMLTSGVGFLWSLLFSLSAILINLYVKDLKDTSGILLIVLAWIFAFIGYHGSEMTVIAPVILTLIFCKSILKKDFRTYGYEITKLLFSYSAFLTYFAHRAYIVSETSEWMSKGLGEFLERLLVLAPQIFFHYIKLFFFPAKLTIDEHHNVVLENAFTPYHLLCFTIALAFVVGIFYFALNKEEKYYLHNQLIAGSLFLTGFGIAISLNIIPLYVLARDRYTYIFALGLTASIILILDKYVFSKYRDLDENTRNQKLKIWTITLAVILVILGIRSAVKNLDWRNGEVFWTQTMKSVDDIGTKQNWRYRLMQYYLDPGTDTFKPNQELKEKTFQEFNSFAQDHKLLERSTMEKYLKESKDPKNHMKNKYGYTGNKTIASGLFFNATEAMKKGNKKAGLEYYRASHLYYPEHYQSNLQMFIATYGVDDTVNKYLLDKLEKEAVGNSFLAKGLMDSMFFIKYKDKYDYAKLFVKRFPNTQVFSVYAFHAAYSSGDFDNAYAYAKEIIKKYTEQDIFEKFIIKYERGEYRKQPLINQ